MPLEEITKMFSRAVYEGGGQIILEEGFRKEKIPLYAWEAYLIARNNKRPIPDWVLNYLDSSARRLFGRMPRKGAANHVATALGLYSQGKGNIFTRYIGIRGIYPVVLDVMQRYAKHPEKSLRHHCADVAEKLGKSGKDVSSVTIEKWYKQYRKELLPRIYTEKAPLPEPPIE